MRKSIYNPTAPYIVDAEYDEKHQCLIITWHTMLALNDLEPCIRAQIKAIKENKVKSIIINTSTAKNTIRKDDMDWMKAFYFPRLIHAKVLEFIVIPPVSAITKQAIEDFTETAHLNGLNIHNCEDLDQALGIARKFIE